MVIARTVIWFWVRVPVLSVTITVVEPSVSTAGSWRIRAWRSAMRRTPSARATVTTMGRPAGMAATESAMPSRSMSSKALPEAIPRPMATTAVPRMPTVIQRVRRRIRRSRGVSISADSPTCSAISPMAVSRPVATTTPRALPEVTPVPRNTRFFCSARGRSGSSARVSVVLVTGVDSPVRAASLTWSDSTSSRRRSAGTMRPWSISTTSPGTRCALSISRGSPSRITRARGVIMEVSDCTADSARYSCRKPTVPLMIRTAPMTMASA